MAAYIYVNSLKMVPEAYPGICNCNLGITGEGGGGGGGTNPT